MIGAIEAKISPSDLLQLLWEFSPSVELVPGGALIQLDRWRGDRLCIERQVGTLKQRLECEVGVAINPFVAKLACAQGRLVEPGQEEAFVAPFPPEVLPIEPESLRRLKLLGFRTLEEVRRLTLPELALQFGQEGELIFQRCRGVDETPLSPQRLPDPIEGSLAIEGDYWVEALKMELLVPLFAQLKERGERCVQMLLSLGEEKLEVNFGRATALSPKGRLGLSLPNQRGDQTA